MLLNLQRLCARASLVARKRYRGAQAVLLYRGCVDTPKKWNTKKLKYKRGTWLQQVSHLFLTVSGFFDNAWLPPARLRPRFNLVICSSSFKRLATSPPGDCSGADVAKPFTFRLQCGSASYPRFVLDFKSSALYFILKVNYIWLQLRIP